MQAPLLHVNEIQCYERLVRLRLPFRYGAVTLTEVPQLFVRVLVENQHGDIDWGVAAELLAPKWFDKNPALSNEDNFNQLRRSLQIAANTYLTAKQHTAFDFFAQHYTEQIDSCASEKLNSLVANYGPALLDRAIVDALCNLADVSFQSAIKNNLVGITTDILTPDLAGFDIDLFLASLTPHHRIQVRHTVGLIDAINASDVITPEHDDLPHSLAAAISKYSLRYFKIKIGGNIDNDIKRLLTIARLLDDLPEYYVTLDGNEQYHTLDHLLEFWQRLNTLPALRRFSQSILFIEQPLDRDIALSQSITPLSQQRAVIIDESDATLESFIQAKELGYSGISSKACKGIYKSLLNAARCSLWNQSSDHFYFMSAEDLSTQAGIAVQQDLALACLLGIEHIERNGHHYVDGFGQASADEAENFFNAHPDLYQREEHNRVRLNIKQGYIDTHSLQGIGFAHGADFDWSTMRRTI